MNEILFDGLGSMGKREGLYYLRSLIFSCLQSPAIMDRYELTVLIDTKNEKLFECLRGKVSIRVYRRQGRLQMGLYERKLVREDRIKHYVALDPGHFRFLYDKCGISRIPDLAHKNLPDCFSEEELARRDLAVLGLVGKKNTLLVGSEAARADLEYFYPDRCCDVRVVPAVSYLEPELQAITRETELDIAEKYDLRKRYVYIPGAFLPYRNHVTVLRAIESLRCREKLPDLRFVFEGKPEECLDPDYRSELERHLQEPVVRESVLFLGSMKRKEELCMMKNAEFIVEPSLCDGWGTALSDAKALDQTVLLSNISAHLEQKTERCLPFDVHNPEELADLMEETARTHIPGNAEQGIARMYRDAAKYAEELEKVFT